MMTSPPHMENPGSDPVSWILKGQPLFKIQDREQQEFMVAPPHTL